MPKFLLFLQQWGPWVLIAYGFGNLFCCTFFYRFQSNLVRRFITSKFVVARLEDPKLDPSNKFFLRAMIKFAESPWLFRYSVVFSACFGVAGVIWLVVRLWG